MKNINNKALIVVDFFQSPIMEIAGEVACKLLKKNSNVEILIIDDYLPSDGFSTRLPKLFDWFDIPLTFKRIFLKNASSNIKLTHKVIQKNIPYENWGKDLLIGKEVNIKHFDISEDVFDPVGATNYKNLWHRGFPLQILKKRNYQNIYKDVIKPDIQADFWNGDPDIDAICRMEHAPECSFDNSCFPFSSNKSAPFNSQNTFLLGSCLKDYFLFPHVGRMDDIWAAYYMQSKGYKVVFNSASVYQERNPHDLTKDMKKEYLGYENNLNLVKDINSDPDAIYSYLPGLSIRAFDLYKRHFN